MSCAPSEMDKDSEVIVNFESLLKKQKSKKPLKLYSDGENLNLSLNESKVGQVSYSAKDVLSNVSKQIKAIQNADTASYKRVGNKLDRYKKREFLTVDMIPIHHEVYQNKAANFETQCFSNTQLINVIENAEIIDKHRGVTQEFDSTFYLKSNEYDSGDEKLENSKMTHVNLYKIQDDANIKANSYDLGLDDDSESQQELTFNKTYKTSEVPLPYLQNDFIPDCDDESHVSVDMDYYQNDQIDVIRASPGFNHKSNHNSQEEYRPTSIIPDAQRRVDTPLVFSLYAFEKFENLVWPIIEEHTDLQTVKKFINSQIIGNELFIPNHNYNYQNNKRLSPILSKIEYITINTNDYLTERSNTGMEVETLNNQIKEEVRISSTDHNKFVNMKEKPINSNVMIETELNNEILFSSDEEDDYLHKDVQELALTCALETTFYNRSYVLDKTMYVGFQTASNKSIQISTDSFRNAKSILSDFENDETSLKELVEIFDLDKNESENSYNENNEGKIDLDHITEAEIEEKIGDTFKNVTFTALELDGDINNDIHVSQIIKFDSSATSKLKEMNEDIFAISCNSKRKLELEGFKTASNKRIRLSDKALARCKKVFQDIDLEHDYEELHCKTEQNSKEADIKLEYKTINLDVSQDIFEISDSETDVYTEEPKTKMEVINPLQINNLVILQEFDENRSLKEADSCVGFKIASKKYMTISEEAKTKNIFQAELSTEDDNVSKRQSFSSDCCNNPKNQVLEKHEQGLKIAKPMKLSKEVSENNKSIFQDVPVNEPTYEDDCEFKLPSPSNFIEFKTAANKEIKISKKAIELTKNFYNVIDKEYKSKVTEGDYTNVDTCQNNITETEDILAEELAVYEDFFKENITESPSPKPETPVFKGFQTASNKAIFISEKAHVTSTKLFEDITNNYDLNNPCDTIVQENESIDSKKAKVRIVNHNSNNLFVNKDEFKVSNNINRNDNKIEDFAAIKGLLDATTHKHEDSIEEQKQIFKGFQTASNKKVSISDEALTKSKKLFQDIDLNQLNKDRTESSKKIVKVPEKHAEKNKNKIKEFHENNEIQHLISLRTASSKPVNISVESLAKSKQIFNDFELQDVGNLLENDDCGKFNSKPSSNKFVGFITASNKEVKVSADALAKSKRMVRDLFKEECNRVNNNSDKHSTSNFVGFPTSSNEEVKISKEAKSKTIFCDVDNSEEITKVFKGFQTASNKRVHISEKALEKSKKLFQDIEPESFKDCVSNKEKNKDDKPFTGFQTASNKKVEISKKGLSYSKKLFEDIDMSQLNKDDRKKMPGDVFHSSHNELEMFRDICEPDKNGDIKCFKGFQTASNKRVIISEQALAKTKVIFANMHEEKEEIHVYSPEKESGINNAVVSLKTGSNVTNSIPKHNSNMVKPSNLDSPDTGMKGIIDTQVLNDFQVSLNTEDFCESTPILKRSGSPTLPCYRAKKKRFGTPYRNEKKGEPKHAYVSPKPANTYKFREDYKTASSKKVEISEKALSYSKKLLEDIEMSQLHKDDRKKMPGDVFNPFINELDTFRDISEPDKNGDIKSFKGFQTAGNKTVIISEQALAKTKIIFANVHEKKKEIHVYNPEKESEINNAVVSLKTGSNVTNSIPKNNSNLVKPSNLDSTDMGIKGFIDTQVLNDLQDSLNTEDFCESTPISKRSRSPILPCPRAKKTRFKTPYRNEKKAEQKHAYVPPKPANTYKFREDYKNNKKYALKDLQTLDDAQTKVEIDLYISKFNFDKLLDFEFFNSRNDYTEGKINVDQLKNIFLDAINKKIVPEGWLDNHIRLILWKLLSYEMKFPNTMKNTCTVRNVMEQLKYRYDRELYNVQRPILRKILEKDDVASKTMVLCVVGIYIDNISVTSVTKATNNIELLLTDGWYCIKACLDRMLCRLVCSNAIVIGCKLATSGAELLGCEQGKTPWEDTSAVRLKLSGNSTRRARWDARLGPRTAVVACPLHAVRAEGGRAAVKAYVARVYPPLYVERMEDGSTVTLSERLEHIRQMKYETEQQILMEKLYEELEKDLTDQESQDSEGCTNEKINCLESGSQISKLIKRSRDPEEYRSHLTASQNLMLEEYNTRRREKQIEDIRIKFQEKLDKSGLKTERNVVPLLKVRIVGFKEKDGVEVTKGYLSIWKPSAAVVEIVNEGTWIELLNVIPTGVRNTEIQLSAGRQTIFNPYKQKSKKIDLHTNILKRKCYDIKELSHNPSMTTEFNEIDTVGMVFLIEPSTKEFDEKQNFQNVFLADADKNIICANFWGGIKKFGFEHVIDTGQIIACVNLQKRAGNTRKSIPQYRVTEFTYFTKTPKDQHAADVTNELSNKLSKIKDKFCEDCVVLKNNYSIFKTRNSENVSPYRFGSYNMSKNNVSPMWCDVNLKLTGLDFESSFKDTEVSPMALLRRKKVNEKIQKLNMYGEPPPLSSIHMINKSKNASATYKSPLISKSSVVNVESESLQNVTSPISLNRTFVKKVNPVKLDFSYGVAAENNLNDCIDHFADEFDASPPLSLDSDVV